MFKKKFDNINFLVGGKIERVLTSPYDLEVCKFLESLSKELEKKIYNKYADLKSLSFWCRKKNLEKLKSSFISEKLKKGKGLIFHITPSNVPTNFVYSLIFGLLTGNSNIIKVPSKKFDQVSIICNLINKILKIKRFKKVKKLINIIRYEKENDEFTKFLSSICDVRIIWGGSKTIKAIRKFPLQERSSELTFADRYSLCLLDSKKIEKLNEFDLKLLVKRFYNDTYLFDQNACSSPHLILWMGNSSSFSRQRFWKTLSLYLEEKYNLPEKASYDKYNKLCNDVVNLKNFKSQEKFGNLIYTLLLNKLDEDVDKMRGKWGYFYEYKINNLNQIKKIINNKFQTLTYFGVEKKLLQTFVKNNLRGIDRVVPIGQALDISLNWDGIDINNALTRVIDIK
tara:strand:- start:1383 stop:2573 length:1191 start_codon:yes stop_codon:yes gene_type:complete